MRTLRDHDAPDGNSARTSGSVPAEEPSPGADVTIPLGAATSGHLIFPSGAAGVTLHADPALADLCQAHFERHIPIVQAKEGAVTIRYPSFSLLNWLVYWREPVAEIRLNTSLPWRFEMRGGVSKLTADLRGLRLTGLDIAGGASGITLVLPAPVGTVPISTGGGASNVTFHRPRGVAVRVRVESGASNLSLDEHYFGAVGGKTDWESPDYKHASDRYDIRIGGGASNLTIGVF